MVQQIKAFIYAIVILLVVGLLQMAPKVQNYKDYLDSLQPSKEYFVSKVELAGFSEKSKEFFRPVFKFNFDLLMELGVTDKNSKKQVRDFVPWRIKEVGGLSSLEKVKIDDDYHFILNLADEDFARIMSQINAFPDHRNLLQSDLLLEVY